MGNSPSQEIDPAAPSQAEQEFDLSKIVDDREPAKKDSEPEINPGLEAAPAERDPHDTDADTDSGRSPSVRPDGTADMARRIDKPNAADPPGSARAQRKKQGKRKNGTRKANGYSNDTDSDTSDDVLTRVSPPADDAPEQHEDDQPLRKTEPELYDEYAMSDQSDVEEDDDRGRAAGRNSFTAVNGASQKSMVHDAVPDDTDSEEEVAVPRGRSAALEDSLDSQKPQVLTDIQPNMEHATSQASLKVPESKVNSEGRFVCPFVDIDGCPETFVNRVGAIKHTRRSRRHNNAGRTDLQAASATLVEGLPATAPLGVASSTTTTKVPELKLTSEGRFLCPFADIDGCETTFTRRQGAIRHVRNQHKTDGDANTPLATTATAIPVEIEVNHETYTNANARPKVAVAKVNDEGRYPCPFAESEGCETTFKDKKTAKTHSKSHTDEFACVVCKQRLSRNDKLRSHLKMHSASEIAAAIQTNEELSQDQSQEEETPEDTNQEAGLELEEPEEDALTEYATPQNSPPEVVPSKLIEKTQQREEDLVDAEKSEAEELGDDLDEASTMSEVEPEVVEGAPDENSEHQSPAPPSIFDEEEIIVKETPMATDRSKRKRGKEGASEAERSSPERTSKRRKGSPNSPPTSMPSDDNRFGSSKPSAVLASARSRQFTDKIIPRLQKRQGSMDGWAKKFTPGSKLKHPTLNPTPPRPATQRIEVVIPRTTQAGPSLTKTKRKNSDTEDEASDVDHKNAEANSRENLGRKKPRQAAYATLKGRKRAEPGVEYSTPAKVATADKTGTSDAEETSPMNIATSVAKRTFHRRKSDDVDTQEDDDDSDPDANSAPDSDSESEQAEKPSKRKSMNANNIELKPKTTKQSGKADQADPTDRAECTRCHRVFVNQKQLNRHQKKRSAHIGLFKCHDCSKEFYAQTVLARHERDTGHGKGDGLQGRVGAFSQNEVDKIDKWRKQFCDYHDINVTEFNDMMTATLERGNSANWRWLFIKRSEFVKEYVAVLPKRNKRSMLRYRERNFQNLEGMKNWTAEDDKELIRLHKQLGPKWADIARRLGRTFDAVSQRWRHKLQYGHVEIGNWSAAEDSKFAKIIIRLQQGALGNELQDHQILWTKVSEEMGSRSAQQCSNHYRALNTKKRAGRFVKTSVPEQTPGSKRVATPSKMEMRLSGKKIGRRGSDNALSEAYIREDDDGDDEAEAEAEAEVEVEVEETDDEEVKNDEAQDEALVEQDSEPEAGSEDRAKSNAASDDEDSSDSPNHDRNPLITKTPSRTLKSSQLFQQTQANTSALKLSQQSIKKKRGHPSQERPSPNVPIQRQSFGSRSPLAELPDLRASQMDNVDEDEQDEEGEEMEEQNNSQRHGNTEDASPEDLKSETSDDDDADEQSTSPEESADEEMIKTESSDEDAEKESKVEASEDEAALKTESDAEEELVDDKAVEVPAATDDEETQSAAEEESASSDETSTDSDSDSDSGSAESDQDEAPPVETKEPISSFMDSINNTAKRANIKKVRSGSHNHTQQMNRSPVPKSGRQRDVWKQVDDDESA